MMYAKGDYIHHAANGLCRVEEVTTLDIAGVDKTKLYYRLTPVENSGSTVFVPVDRCEGKTRTAMTGEEARALIAQIPSIETLWIPEERAREQRYKEALLSMDCRNWVRIIKTLYLRRLDRQARGQKVTSTDEKYLRSAENRLYSEMAMALGLSKEEMEEYITRQIEQVELNGARS